jgi:hypothetical protein
VFLSKKATHKPCKSVQLQASHYCHHAVLEQSFIVKGPFEKLPKAERPQTNI